METKYFDVHVFIKRNQGYSFGVKMEVPKGTDVQDEAVIEYAAKNNLFQEEGDGEMVDTVDEIEEKEFNDIYGKP
jgi:hypothetical protein